MNTVNIILLTMSLSVIFPLVNAQAGEAGAVQQGVGLGLIGFKQGMETIPINGTSIPLNANDTVWLFALRDISVDYGPTDHNIISIERVPAGKEVSLRPAPIQCCGVSEKYRLRITAHSAPGDYRGFEEASLLYVGGEESRIVTPSISFGNASIRIMLDGLPPRSSTQYALLKPGLDESRAIGRYGAVQYRSVVKPQSTMRILYEPAGGGGLANLTIHFVLISTRSFLSETGEPGNIIRLHRDGIVASTSVKLNRTVEGPIPVNLKLASLGEPGAGGETPLQMGRHFLYIYIEGESIISREQGEKNVGGGYGGDYGDYAGGGGAEEEAFLPIYVLKNDEYTLLGQTLPSEEGIDLLFTEDIPHKMLVVATPQINGVTLALYAAELTIPLTKIMLYDGDQQVNDYTLFLEPRLPSTQVGGVTYVIGETLGKSAFLTRVKVHNFTLPSYEVEGGRDGEIGFPAILNVTTRLNRVTVSTVNELGEAVSDGWVKIEKGGEIYRYSAGPSRTLRIPDGTYTMTLIVGERPVAEKTVTVDSPRTITLTVSTIQGIDIVLLAIVLIEIPAVAILGVMILRSNYYL